MMLSVMPVISFADATDDAPYADSVATLGNAIANPTKAENFNQFNTAAVSPVTTTPGIYIWDVKSETTAGSGFDGKLAGCLFRTSGGDYVDSNFKVAAGEKLILRMPVKNYGSTNSVKVNASLINSGAWGNANYSLEYGADGVEVTDKENWTILEFTFIMPGTTGTEYKPRLVFGFPAGVTAGNAIAINLSANNGPLALVGKEEPASIELEGDFSGALEVGAEVNLTASILNPLGKVGALDQTKIKYYVTNEERTEKIETAGAFTFDGNKLTIGSAANSGNYCIVAESTVNSSVRKGISFTVLEPKKQDYVPGAEVAGEPYDITLTRTSEDKEYYTSLDTLTLSASLVDKAGLTDGLTQDISWAVIESDLRYENTDGLIDISTENGNATVTFDPATPEGTYYIRAYKTGDIMFGKNFQVVIDNGQILTDIIKELNEDTNGKLKENLPKYIPYIDAQNTLYEKTDKENLDKVIKAMVGAGEVFTDENLKDNFKVACVLSLGNVPSQDVALNTEDGSFVYAALLGLDKVDADGATLYTEVYVEDITDAGKAKVISAVSAAQTKAEAVSAFCEATLLAAISDTDYLGTSYVTELLTEENLKAAGIEAKGYLASDAKEMYEDEIAHKELTKKELEDILANEYSAEEEDDDDYSAPSRRPSVTGPSVSAPTPVVKEENSGTKDIHFNDLSESHWAFVNIQFLAKLDVLKGDENGNFNPEKAVTREEFVKILVEAFDLTGGAQSGFADVVSGSWYADYVSVAAANGVITGKEDGRFGVGEAVTREDMCVMIARVLGMGDDAEGSLAYSDADSIAPYAKNSVGYLSMLSMINGMPDNTFRPKDVCTRSQAARVIADILNYNVMEVNG